MDHETAVRTNAAVRYYLKELEATESEALEDHVAECPACCEDLRCLTIFAANTKAVFAEETAAPRVIERRANWLDRLRPSRAPALALSAVANVLLILGLGYEISNLALYTAPHAVPSIAGVRAEKGETPAAVRYGETSVLLYFDLPERRPANYAYQLSAGGSVVRSGSVPAPTQPEDTLNLDFPIAGLPRGQYRLRLFDADRKSDEIGTAAFEIK